MSKGEIDYTLDYLCGECLIYSTIDDDHFTFLDCALDDYGLDEEVREELLRGNMRSMYELPATPYGLGEAEHEELLRGNMKSMYEL